MAVLKPVVACVLAIGATALWAGPVEGHEPGEGASRPPAVSVTAPAASSRAPAVPAGDGTARAGGGEPEEHGNAGAAVVAATGVLALVGSAAVARRRTGNLHGDLRAGSPEDLHRDVPPPAGRTGAVPGPSHRR